MSLFWITIVVAIVSYVLWRLYRGRKMRSEAYQKRFAKLSEEDLRRLVDGMKRPLNRDEIPPPTVDPTGWRLEGIKGQQVWKHYEKGKAPRPQNACERYHLGLELTETDAPTLKKAKTAAESAMNGSLFATRVQVPDTGHWANDYGGPMFLLPGLIIAHYVSKTPLPDAHRTEMIRYLRSKQNGDGGFGLHIEGPSCIFGTSLSYVSLRILGVPAKDKACTRALAFMKPHGGVLGAPSWAKFWLTILGVYEYEGLQPLNPEVWILPRWVPFHPWRFWCHCRMVYLPMAYCYCARYVGPKTKLVEELRHELYDGIGGYEGVEWASHRFHTCELDYYQPLGRVMKISFTLLGIYENLPALPFVNIRERALNWLAELIDVEDESTNYIDIGPVNKAMNMVAILSRHGADSERFKKHLARAQDYLWQSFDGMKMQGYNGSQLWDTAFMAQAMAAAVKGARAAQPSIAENERVNASLIHAYQFIDISQVQRDVKKADYYYRHQSDGAWPFSTEAHGWPIADCTSEGMKGALAVERLDVLPKSTKTITLARYKKAIDVMLSLHNADDGGWPTYELKRGDEWLELVNPAEVFARIMVDYSYCELTSACVQGLAAFAKAGDEAKEYRRAEVEHAVARGTLFVKNRQRDDGSWYGSWAVCFTYAAWFGVEALVCRGEGSSDNVKRAVEFLLKKQNKDGGWGETWWSCLLGEYCSADSTPECTGWALLAILRAYEGGVVRDRPSLKTALLRGAKRAAECLIQLQLPNGDWKQGSAAGIFNGSCSINYGNYKNIFPIWALGEYARLIDGAAKPNDS